MRFLLSKLRIFLFFPTPYLSQPLFAFSGKFWLLRQTGFYDKMKHIENSGGDRHENTKFAGAGIPAQCVDQSEDQRTELREDKRG